MRISLLCLYLITFSCSTFGQWYESKGVAVIKNGDNKTAKTQAMQNALKKALLVAGASVSSVRQVVNGLLTQDEINIRASGNINSFELINEIYTDDLVSVTIRADIFPQEKKCFASDYRKSMLLTRSNLLFREQANIGKVYNLDKSLVEKLASQIGQEGLYLDTKLALQSKTEFSRLNNTLQMEAIKSLAMSLASMTDTQYIFFSEIQDISLATGEENGWQFWQEDIFERQFSLALYIHDGINGERIYEKQYQGSAPWDFTKRARVDVNSANFWQSAYGNNIEQLLSEVVTDIDENMMCQPTRGKIVQINGNKVTINLGKRHGVKVGDEFSLLHLNNFTSDDRNSYAGFSISPYKVTVSSVTNDNASATTSDDHILGNIQRNDLAVRY
jgi:hypothetical protein